MTANPTVKRVLVAVLVMGLAGSRMFAAERVSHEQAVAERCQRCASSRGAFRQYQRQSNWRGKPCNDWDHC